MKNRLSNNKSKWGCKSCNLKSNKSASYFILKNKLSSLGLVKQRALPRVESILGRKTLEAYVEMVAKPIIDYKSKVNEEVKAR